MLAGHMDNSFLESLLLDNPVQKQAFGQDCMLQLQLCSSVLLQV